MNPIKLDELVAMKLTRTLRVREEARPSRRPPPVPQGPFARPRTPSSSSTSPTASPPCQTSSTTSSIPPPSPIVSPRFSTSSASVVPPPTNLAPSLSSPFPIVPAHFIKRATEEPTPSKTIAAVAIWSTSEVKVAATLALPFVVGNEEGAAEEQRTKIGEENAIAACEERGMHQPLLHAASSPEVLADVSCCQLCLRAVASGEDRSRRCWPLDCQKERPTPVPCHHNERERARVSQLPILRESFPSKHQEGHAIKDHHAFLYNLQCTATTQASQ
nr:hypothetical protein Iba_chr04bCG12980 [Ipomoea batatas]